MKKATAVLAAICITCAGYSQSTGPASTLDSMSAIAINYLQAKQADSLYALAGSNFRSKLSAADFKAIAENQVFQINDFQRVSFVRNINGINKYKVEGTPVLQLFIGLDAEHKLETFLIQPFSDD